MLFRAPDNSPNGEAAFHRAPNKSPNCASELCSAADNKADGAVALYRAPDIALDISSDGTVVLRIHVTRQMAQLSYAMLQIML